MRSKTYQAIKDKIPQEPVDIATAVSFLQENDSRKFDGTIEIHIRLGVDSKKSEQTVRGTVTLPAGAAKKQRIVVFTADPDQQQQLEQAGVQTGGEELIDQIASNSPFAADITITTPGLMPQVAKIARILGPKGLMPNPRTGTVTPDPVSLVKALQSGQVSFKMDKQGNIHGAVAKISWDQDRIVANIKEFIKAVASARPAAVKGEFIRSVSLKSTMSPAIRLAN